jgi:translation initiation factor 2B subunit (eIF-2B alpha/beta/delta family)
MGPLAKMDDDVQRIAADARSSASLLFGDAVRLLRAARQRGEDDLGRTAIRLCRAQPAMGAFWNAAAAALAPSPDLLDALEARARRAPAAIARLAVDLFANDGTAGPLRLITCSRSGSVEACIRALADERDIVVACAEGRPGMEGQALAGALSATGLHVELFTDAAITAAFETGSVVLVGADAVTAGWFINKVGSGQLCSAALLAGIPAYAVTGREKFVAEPIAERLVLKEGDPRDVLEWDATLVMVRNPLFERIPLDRVAGILTDAGLLAGDMVAAACASSLPAAQVSALMAMIADLDGSEPA